MGRVGVYLRVRVKWVRRQTPVAWNSTMTALNVWSLNVRAPEPAVSESVAIERRRPACGHRACSRRPRVLPQVQWFAVRARDVPSLSRCAGDPARGLSNADHRASGEEEVGLEE